MPLDVVSLDILKEYIDETPGARIYFRSDGRKMTIVAGMLSWRGRVEDLDAVKEFLESHGAIEVTGYSDVRELFA